MWHSYQGLRGFTADPQIAEVAYFQSRLLQTTTVMVVHGHIWTFCYYTLLKSPGSSMFNFCNLNAEMVSTKLILKNILLSAFMFLTPQ